MVGEAVAAVWDQQQLRTRGLAGQAFGVIGGDQAVPAAGRDEQRTSDAYGGLLQGEGPGPLAGFARR